MNSPFALDRVARARMMVVGCGALGNEVLKHLALLGVGHVVIVDFDRVEADNLSRSVLFTADDAKANRPKVAVVAERLRQMNPRMEVTAIEGDVAYDVGLGLIRTMDVLIGCVDNRWARYCINRRVDGGIDVMEGTVRVFVPGKNCYACNLGPEGLKDMTRRLSCAGVIRRNIEAGKTPTTSVIASVIGAVQVQEALKLLCEDSLRQGELTSLCGSMFYYEGQHLTTRLVRFQAYDDDCPVHERWDPVRPVALTKDTTVADALQLLQEELQISAVSIGLTDDCFVDYVERRDNDRRRQVMRPGRAVAAFVEQDRELCGLPFSALYQHEWRQVDNQFPYQQLTLAELGLPAQAVLPVSSLLKTCYIEIR